MNPMTTANGFFAMSRKIQTVIICLVVLLSWKNIVSADMVSNDNKYLLNQEEYMKQSIE